MEMARDDYAATAGAPPAFLQQLPNSCPADTDRATTNDMTVSRKYRGELA
jgi:hypothetical protein